MMMYYTDASVYNMPLTEKRKQVCWRVRILLSALRIHRLMMREAYTR